MKCSMVAIHQGSPAFAMEATTCSLGPMPTLPDDLLVKKKDCLKNCFCFVNGGLSCSTRAQTLEGWKFSSRMPLNIF